ncbi:glycosyltransferase (activator-dependent family) [Crossiella equi]|uniref:Glycosyltransferase (Activator-dependent family) n=1 Tax=Crossiella equi TaxID=130796 RepID=A0ABS5AAA2_9PSEU|nr:nucleotide disphospho-sugar-binding domain-containing protein [Crossiella equi]MBP2473510.1 glycosyltransferase (activator-dependent family) [Crossiella equi]
MRVLFATHAEPTHFHGMVPLAWALQNAGHEVRVASQPALTGVVTSAGLTAVPLGTDHRLHEVLRRTGRLAEADPLPFDFARPAEEITWPWLEAGYRAFVPWWLRLVNDGLIAELTAFCLDWRPDLVLWEPLTHAGAVAAQACGAVHGRVLWGLDLFGRMRAHFLRLRPPGAPDPLADWLTARGAVFEEALVTGQFTIDHTPPSLRTGTCDLPGLDHLPVRWVPCGGAAAVPDWLRERPRLPRVCLTLGTSGFAPTDRRGGLAELLTALACPEVELVATVPPSAVPPGLPNVRAVPFTPLDALLPSCAVVVHHGGHGTYRTALLHGVPQLVLANVFDLGLRARHLAAEGAGLTASSAPEVAAAAHRLRTEPRFRLHAARLRAEALTLPSPCDLVPELELRAAVGRNHHAHPVRVLRRENPLPDTGAPGLGTPERRP